MPELAGVWLGVDFGKRRIGLATGQALTGTAQPLKTLHHSGDPFPDFERVLREWRPVCVVVGLPLGKDGKETPMSQAARSFAARIAENHPERQVVLHDERFSSREADERFRAARREGRARRRDAAELDSHAAAVILESWLAAGDRIA
jgi:putative Holliday junction resolvase